MKQLSILMMAFLLVLGACKTTSKTTTDEPFNPRAEEVGDKPSKGEKPAFFVGEATPGKLEFKAESSRYKADGSFKKWHFTKMEIPNKKAKDLTGMTATLEVETASVQEKADGLREHMMQNDYLDVEKYPKATAEIKDVVKTEGNSYKGTVVLKIKDISAEYPMKFEFSEDAGVFHVKGETTILRQTYNMGGDGIKNEVLVLFDTDLK
jgi:polyisoprenoid-binding protein YceI